MKYSPADQITPANVATLTQAWTYPTGGAAPIVIDNLMYFVAGGNVVALNADAGTEAWKFALERGDARRRHSPRHDLLARHAAARAARAGHDERRQARAARCEDGQADSATPASSIW